MAYTAIDDPSAFFQTVLWQGNGSSGRAITLGGNSDLQPDLVWFKDRTDTEANKLFDSVRGATKSVRSQDGSAEATNTEDLQAFSSDGFTVGSNGSVNKSNGDRYVAWNWKAGTSFTNDASGTGIGTVDSAGSVNTDAGFSITKFTADGNNLTAAHGLGVAPTMIWTKNLSISKNWSVYHSSLGAGKSIFLNVTDVADTDNTYWNNTAPTSTTLSYGTWSGNNNGNEIIAYCFAEKQGYSKFGGYVANSDSSTFLYTGFKPAFLMVKQTDSGGNQNWGMFDNKRIGFNPSNYFLYANTSAAEDTSNAASIDLLSNGFQLRANTVGSNPTKSYIYMAFAENPFVTSTGVPATAR